MGYTIHYSPIGRDGVEAVLACIDMRQAFDHACVLEHRGDTVNWISDGAGERFSRDAIVAYRRTRKLPGEKQGGMTGSEAREKTKELSTSAFRKVRGAADLVRQVNPAAGWFPLALGGAVSTAVGAGIGVGLGLLYPGHHQLWAVLSLIGAMAGSLGGWHLAMRSTAQHERHLNEIL